MGKTTLSMEILLHSIYLTVAKFKIADLSFYLNYVSMFYIIIINNFNLVLRFKMRNASVNGPLPKAMIACYNIRKLINFSQVHLFKMFQLSFI